MQVLIQVHQIMILLCQALGQIVEHSQTDHKQLLLMAHLTKVLQVLQQLHFII